MTTSRPNTAALVVALFLGIALAPAPGPLEAAGPDFNGDGYDDLAVGAPGNRTDGTRWAGVVSILYGAASGPNPDLTQTWHQGSPGIVGGLEKGDGFGHAVTAGDFDGDGFSDLAVGSPSEDLATGKNAGLVHVLYGSAGLSATNSQAWHQNVGGIPEESETNDYFGFALTSGDFDGDGFDDLAIGVPFESVGSQSRAGAVHVLHGSASGLATARNQLWTQDSGSVLGASETDDFFGFALAAGDFDDDGFDDLAIGVPMENLGSAKDAGLVNVLYGSGAGLSSSRDQTWHQDRPGVRGGVEPGDWLGYSLAAGDFDGDGFDDLAMGIPLEDLAGLSDTGAALVLYGGVGGLASARNRFVQDFSGTPPTSERDDAFGSVLRAGDLNGDGFDDLAVGTPRENVGSVVDAGVVDVLYGTPDGLPGRPDQIWSQSSAGIAGGPEPYDQLGLGVGIADVNGDGRAELAIGIPSEDLRGALVLLRGGPTGTTGAGSLFVYQDALGSEEARIRNEWFGFALP